MLEANKYNHNIVKDYNESEQAYRKYLIPQLEIDFKSKIWLAGQSEGERALDHYAGTDALMLLPDNSMVAVALRIQRDSNYNSFTIRLKRNSGNETEFAKMKRLINNPNAIKPWIMVHAYLVGNQLSYAIAETIPLYRWMAENPFAIQKLNTDNASFLAISWHLLKEQEWFSQKAITIKGE